MIKKSWLVLLLLSIMAAVALPPGAATHPGFACIQTQAIHSYGGSSGVGGGGGGSGAVVSRASVRDTCAQDLNSNGVILDHDGDYDTGLGSGAFPAGTHTECIDWPGVPHHEYGPGAAYWADDETGMAQIVYWAGTDGPALLASNPCAADGIITNHDLTDPLDCGSGALGQFSAFQWRPATLGRNTAAADCDPIEGYVWMFVLTGPYVDDATGAVIMSTPFSGHLWSGGSSYEYGYLQRVGFTSDPPFD